jgi:2-oxoglutarate ferredoxin oxidoreductase subunit delta
MSTKTTVVTRGTVVIDTERCKGCELCIDACRPGVLSMSTEVNENGYRFPLLVEGCTACRACRDVCPDFCFDVFKYDDPITAQVPQHVGEVG